MPERFNHCNGITAMSHIHEPIHLPQTGEQNCPITREPGQILRVNYKKGNAEKTRDSSTQVIIRFKVTTTGSLSLAPSLPPPLSPPHSVPPSLSSGTV